MTRVTVPTIHQPGEAPTPAASMSGSEHQEEIAVLSTRVAQLALLIEDAQALGNTAAEYSLRIQYHQAAAALLASVQAWNNETDTRSEALRHRHLARANEYQALLDRLGE